MRILFSSNAFWASTGYGIQAQHLLPRFQALGHTVAQHAWYGLMGGVMETNGITVYPGWRDPYGNDIMAAHAKHFRADLLITLIDLWVLDPDAMKKADCPWLAWFPIDHAPVSSHILDRAKACDYPVQYSRFGLAETERAGVPCRYVPHGVNTAVYSPGDQRAARRRLHLPDDAFLVSMVAANKGYPDRKAFQWQLEAFRDFQRDHANAVLYLHTMRQAPDGIDLDQLITALGIPSEAIRFADQYRLIIGLPEKYLADIYRASDVLLGAAMAEGFGIPLVEAQSCGTPVITTNFSAMPELTINGVVTEPATKLFIPLFQAWQAIPSVENVRAALEQVHGWSAAERAERSAEGVAHMRREYDWDVVVGNYWRPLFEEIAAERGLDVPEPVAVPA